MVGGGAAEASLSVDDRGVFVPGVRGANRKGPDVRGNVWKVGEEELKSAGFYFGDDSTVDDCETEGSQDPASVC